MKICSALLMTLIASVVLATTLFAQTWNFQIVETNVRESQIVVASDGTPYLAYLGSYGLSVARWVSTGGNTGSWEKTLIGEEYPFCYQCRIKTLMDSDDNLHIAADVGEGYGILYGVLNTHTQPMSWIVPLEYVPNTQAGFAYFDLALFDDEGSVTPYIVYDLKAYLGPPPTDLNLAKRDPTNGAWSTISIYNYAYVSGNPSVAIDETGHFHISFFEFGSVIPDGGSLMYATNATPVDSVISEYVDVSGTFGPYNSIVIDADGHPLIVYYDHNNGDLKYAKIATP